MIQSSKNGSLHFHLFARNEALHWQNWSGYMIAMFNSKGIVYDDDDPPHTISIWFPFLLEKRERVELWIVKGEWVVVWWWWWIGCGLDVDWMEVAITYNIGHVRHYHHQPAIILCQAMQHGKMLMRCDDIGIITLLMVFCIACQKRQSCRQHHRSHTPIRRYYNDTAILTMSNEQRHTLT